MIATFVSLWLSFDSFSVKLDIDILRAEYQ